MDDLPACPECGADNEPSVRRCRICAALLDASVPPDAEPVGPAPGAALLVSDEVPDDVSSEEIDRLTAAALRDERLARRPGFLDRVFKGEGRSPRPR